MTASFTKKPLWESPERVSADIERALDTPWFWRWIC